MDLQPPMPPKESYANLRMMYNSIISYHNAIVQMRFTVAGFHLAATGVLAGIWFSPAATTQPSNAIPLLGIAITLVCTFLEVRNNQLLENLGMQGREIECDLQIPCSIGFFALMRHQPLPPRLNNKVKAIPIPGTYSHSRALGLWYLGAASFWIAILASVAISTTFGYAAGICLFVGVASFLWGYYSSAPRQVRCPPHCPPQEYAESASPTTATPDR